MDVPGVPAIGSPARDGGVAGGSEAAELRRFLPVALVSGLLGLGALFAGVSEAHRYVTSPPATGEYAFWYAIGWCVQTGVLLVAMAIAGVLALIGLLLRHSWLAAPLILVAGFSIGLYGGMRVLPALGVAYHAPVPAQAVSTPRPSPLLASGTGSVVVAGADSLTARPGSVTCDSAVGSSTGWVDVRGVAAWRGARLGALVWLHGSSSASVEIIVGDAASSMADPPHWQGQATWSGDVSQGRVTFRDLAQTSGYSNADWPATVTGQVSWSCGPWSTQSSPASDAPG